MRGMPPLDALHGCLLYGAPGTPRPPQPPRQERRPAALTLAAREE